MSVKCDPCAIQLQEGDLQFDNFIMIHDPKMFTLFQMTLTQNTIETDIETDI